MSEFYLPGPCPLPVFSKWLVNEGKGEEIKKQGTNDPNCIQWNFSPGVWVGLHGIFPRVSFFENSQTLPFPKMDLKM